MEGGGKKGEGGREVLHFLSVLGGGGGGGGREVSIFGEVVTLHSTGHIVCDIFILAVFYGFVFIK